MCVIFYQTKNQDAFTYDDIKNAALSNPDGMGWMANLDGIIKYKKGYFNVDEFYNDYIELRNNKKLVDIALHFRIGTGSAIDIANCHPFPVTRNVKKIRRAKGRCDVAIMMNGIIGNSTKQFSDTAIYTMNNLRNYYDNDSRWFLHMNKAQKILFNNEIHGCRFVFMCKDGTKLFGTGWSDYEKKGQVSNRHWIPRKYVPYSYFDDNIYAYNGNNNRTKDRWDSWYYNYDYDYDDDGEWLANKAKRFAKKKSDERYKSYIDYLLEGKA